MADSNSKVTIYASIFEENSSATHGAVISAVNIISNTFEIRSCKFTFNQAGFSMASLVNSNMEVWDSFFEDNTSLSVTHGFALTDSKLTMYSVQIRSASRTNPID